jgi:hypothetical protein
MSVIIFSTLKFIIIIIGICILYNYSKHVYNIIKDNNEITITEIISKVKYRLLFFIFYVFLTVNVFNMETPYRPKTNLNVSAPKMVDMNKEVTIKEVAPENFKSDIKKSREENKEAINSFRNLDTK